tara:strand:+ start:849 stop:1472 length:624 start_codon:yes stop_codon:yes gene_type:complete
MKIEDLRIGNYIKSENWSRIGLDWFMIYKSDLHIMTEEGRDLSVYKPIPLTDDWAVKFGYKDLVYMAAGFNNSSKLAIEITPEDLFYMDVHEAQNLYFALTGEELKMDMETVAWKPANTGSYLDLNDTPTPEEMNIRFGSPLTPTGEAELLDKLAGMAMQGMLANPMLTTIRLLDNGYSSDLFSTAAYTIAEAMLKERSKRYKDINT